MGLKSVFLLGTQFILHFLLKLIPFRRDRGAGRFIENYRDDHLQPLTPAEREMLPGWQRCTNCGLCEAVCPLDSAPLDPAGLSFNRLANSAWRDPTAHRLVAASAARLVDCEPCGRCEAICPEEIPLRELARAVARA